MSEYKFMFMNHHLANVSPDTVRTRSPSVKSSHTISAAWLSAQSHAIVRMVLTLFLSFLTSDQGWRRFDLDLI